MERSNSNSIPFHLHTGLRHSSSVRVPQDQMFSVKLWSAPNTNFFFSIREVYPMSFITQSSGRLEAISSKHLVLIPNLATSDYAYLGK